MQPPAADGSSEIDPEWWLEFRRQASGLAATFTPAILGFAAPLDNVSALLDGTRRPAALAWPVLLSAVVWAFLWGGVLHRFATGDSSARGILSAATRCFGRLMAITMLAAAANLLIYLSVHAVLLGTLYDAIAASVSTERDAFLARVVLSVDLRRRPRAAQCRLFFRPNRHRRARRAQHRARAHQRLAFVQSGPDLREALYVIFVTRVCPGDDRLWRSRTGRWFARRRMARGRDRAGVHCLRLALRLALAASQVRLAATAAIVRTKVKDVVAASRLGATHCRVARIGMHAPYRHSRLFALQGRRSRSRKRAPRSTSVGHRMSGSRR